MKKLFWTSALLIAATCTAHAAPPTTAPAPAAANAPTAAPTAQALLGQWSHESEAEIGHLKQVTVLQAQNKFTQHAVYTDAQGKVVADNHTTGRWSVQGTQFTRVFTTFNNQKLKPRDQARFEQTIQSFSENQFTTRIAETGEVLVFKRIP